MGRKGETAYVEYQMAQISTHRLDGLECCVEVRKIAGFELGMKYLAIHYDLKCAAA